MEQATHTLYNKYRPISFNDVIGQEHITKIISKSIEQNRVSHAYLMCGTRGSGKTTTARLIAMCLNCHNGPTNKPCGKCEACIDIIENRCIDIVEIDCASQNKIDDIRELKKSVNTVPSQVKTKIYIMDEVHQLTQSAQNSFLKILEEPPKHVLFVLCTTEPEKLKDTILSRCQVHQFHRISSIKLAERLMSIAEQEDVILSEEAALSLARASEGGARDAIGKLDSAICLADDKNITIDITQQVLGTIGLEHISNLMDTILKKDTAEILKSIGKIVDCSAMLNPVYMSFIRYFGNLMTLSICEEFVSELDVSPNRGAIMQTQAKQKSAKWFTQAMKIALEYSRLMDSIKGRLALETMCLELAQYELPHLQQTFDSVTPKAKQWGEIKGWMAPQLVSLFAGIKTPPFLDIHGLHLPYDELPETAQKMVDYFYDKIIETLRAHGETAIIIKTAAKVTAATDIFQ